MTQPDDTDLIAPALITVYTIGDGAKDAAFTLKEQWVSCRDVFEPGSLLRICEIREGKKHDFFTEPRVHSTPYADSILGIILCSDRDRYDANADYFLNANFMQHHDMVTFHMSLSVATEHRHRLQVPKSFRVIVLPDNNIKTHSNSAWSLISVIFDRGYVCIDFSDVRTCLSFCDQVYYYRAEDNTYSGLTGRLKDLIPRLGMTQAQSCLGRIKGRFDIELSYFTEIGDLIEDGIQPEALVALGMLGLKEDASDSVCIDLFMGL